MVSNSDDSVEPTIKLSEILNKLDTKTSKLIHPEQAWLTVGGSRESANAGVTYGGYIHLISGTIHDTKYIFYESRSFPVDEPLTLEPFSEYGTNADKYSTEGLLWNKY